MKIKNCCKIQWVFLTLSFFLYQKASAILPLPVDLWDIAENDADQITIPENTDDPRSIPAYYELYEKGQLREMELPDFKIQSDVLGYHEATFAVPEGLRTRVDFWKKIYSTYTTDQAVIHDSLYPEIIYDVVDISTFTHDKTLSGRALSRKLSRHLKDRKKSVAELLKQLHGLQSNPLAITADGFKIFRQFENISEPDKFLTASKRVRTQIGQRDRVVQGFLFGGRYFHRMVEIFEARKLPKELTRLPLVESAFNLAARSKVGASGVWQFMRETGKRYMRIDKLIDERNDPIRATAAAASLLESNYEALGSWPLAITAYNHGREGVARAVREVATTDLPTIIKVYRGRTFGFASANFYAEFLAMLEVEKDFRKYFGKVMVDPSLEYVELALLKPTKLSALAKYCDISTHDLEVLNPALLDPITNEKVAVPEGYRLRIFPKNKEKCKTNFKDGIVDG